jgi:hypothetical protein
MQTANNDTTSIEAKTAGDVVSFTIPRLDISAIVTIEE